MIRTIAAAVVAVTLLVVVGGIAIVGAYLRLPRGCYDWAARVWSRAILLASGVPVRVIGAEHIRRDRPQVIACTHQSAYDVLVLAMAVPVRFHFMAKKELRRIPIFGRAAAAAGHVFIDRGDRAAAIESLKVAAEKMRAAQSSAIVFPEGTRSLTGELQPFKKGPFIMSIQAGVPIVPTVVYGTFGILPKRGRRLRPQPVTLWFGEPVDASRYDHARRDELIAEVHARMKAMLDTLRGKAARVDTSLGAR